MCSGAHAQRIGLAAAVKRGHDDGAMVNRDANNFFGDLRDKIGALHANGNQRGVQTKAVFGGLGCSARDGAGFARVKA